MFICEKCGCSNEKYFGIRNGKYYCRQCISFQGTQAVSRIIEMNADLNEVLDYKLSEEQENVSNKVKESFANNKNTLIYAVCGAGKTELVYKTISFALGKGLQVGFAIPRKDVVIELAPRIEKTFPTTKITMVYGGHTNDLEGDIIVLTTHQLFRYDNYFDLLIIDETDAFPFSNNEILMNMFFKSVRGNYIMMSATPLKWMNDKIKESNGTIVKLMKRYHGHPLVVPKIIIIPFFYSIYVIYKLKEYEKNKKPCFVFCPSIDCAENLFLKIKLVCKNGEVVHSKKKSREQIISDFKLGKYNYLITTSVLERGVTVKNIQVIVVESDSPIYTDATLIQISGRVGRKIDAYDGEVLFLCGKESENIVNAINKIKEANSYVSM